MPNEEISQGSQENYDDLCTAIVVFTVENNASRVSEDTDIRDKRVIFTYEAVIVSTVMHKIKKFRKKQYKFSQVQFIIRNDSSK